MPTTFGSVTRNIFENKEMQKLHLEFEVAAGQTIAKGQLVKLNTAGEVVAAAAADEAALIIGPSIHDAVAGELITVVCKGHVVVWGENGTAGALDAGAVSVGAYNTTTGYQEYNAPVGATAEARAALTVGINLDQAAADGDLIRVMLY